MEKGDRTGGAIRTTSRSTTGSTAGDYADGSSLGRDRREGSGRVPNISHLALSLASKSGTPDEAIALLEELRGTVQDEATAARLDEQLKLAVLERDAQSLERPQPSTLGAPAYRSLRSTCW